MRTLRVFLTHNTEDREAYYGRARPRLEEIADVAVNQLDRDLTTDELVAAAEGCDVIVAHRSTPGEAALFEWLPDLLAFLRTAVDTSTIDVEAASDHGVLVACADKSFVPSTAELALGLLLAVVRNIGVSTVDYAAGRPPVQRPGRQIRGQTAGIIGYGSIGSYLAELLVAVGMDVVVHDPFIDVEAVVEAAETTAAEGAFGIAFVDTLDELLGRADAVFPLAPGGPGTDGLIGAAELAAMKSGAVLVNVSRGELLDEVAVADALTSGRLGGLGMDVGRASDQRPSPELAALAGVVATPHLGGLTPENADAQAMSSVEQVAAMLAGEVPPRSLNADHATRLRAVWARSGS